MIRKRNTLQLGDRFRYLEGTQEGSEYTIDLTDDADGTGQARVTNPAQEDTNVLVLSGPTLDAAVAATPPAILTTDKKARKEMPMARGLVDYFPRALAAVANVSFVANEQHNPGQPMHWAKGKSTDHADCIMRHLVERGSVDDDGLRHSAKLAWRALALLETELTDGQ